MAGRIIVLLDMDCFYVQVEERDNPHIKGNPAAVVQYNTWKGGGIIAVNYEARAYGVRRGMRGDEAKEKCPSIHLIQVPTQRGKADLTKYRNAGKEVVSVLCDFSECVERASIDEAYIDLTQVIKEKALSADVGAKDLPSTWVIGYDEEREDVPLSALREEGLIRWLQEGISVDTEADATNRLALASLLCEQMRRRVLEVTGFKCSAGISHNKMLGKLACGLHKPNQQSVLPLKSVPGLWSKMPVGKVRNLGGKLGDSLTTDLDCRTMGDLCKISLERLRAKYEDKTARWLHCLARGIDQEPVVSRHLPKSIGCSKNFTGKEALNSKEKVRTWMKGLAEELSERLDEDEKSNGRLAKTLTVHMRTNADEKNVTTRSCPLPSNKADAIAKTALSLIAATNTAGAKDDKWSPPVSSISLSASKFEAIGTASTMKIDDFLKKGNVNACMTSNTSKRERQIDGTQSVIEPEYSTTIKHSGNEPMALHRTEETKQSIKDGIYEKSFFLQFLVRNKGNGKKFYDSDSVAGDQRISDVKQKQDFEDKGDSSRDSDEYDSIYDNSTDVDEVEFLGCVEREEGESTSSPVLKSKLHPNGSSLNPLNHCRSHFSSNTEVNRGSGRAIDSSRVVTATASSSLSRWENHSSLEENSDGVSVEDLFPDLNDVDPSVVEILPASLQNRIQRALDQHRSKLGHKREDKERSIAQSDRPLEAKESTILEVKFRNQTETNASPDLKDREGNASPDARNTDEFRFCEECKRQILSKKFLEHQDFHFASELRRQQLNESKIIIASKTKRKSKKGTSGNDSKRSKKSPSYKIENYFKKKDR